MSSELAYLAVILPEEEPTVLVLPLPAGLLLKLSMPEMPTLNVLTPKLSMSVLRAACSTAWNAGLVSEWPCTTVSMSFTGVIDA